jgi:hypothetical protein
MEKAIIGINQQKKAIMKQRLTSSVSIFFTSPYLIIRIVPRAAMPTTTIDQPTISHLKKSDTTLCSFLEYWNSGILVK